MWDQGIEGSGAWLRLTGSLLTSQSGNQTKSWGNTGRGGRVQGGGHAVIGLFCEREEIGLYFSVMLVECAGWSNVAS